MILDMDIIDNPSNEATVIVRISDNISLYQISNDSLQWYNYSTHYLL